jgi:hypothetical protein
MNGDGEMDKKLKITLTITRTVIFLGLGTGVCIRELFLKSSYDLQTLCIGWGMMMGEGFISAWILSKITIEPRSQHQQQQP